MCCSRWTPSRLCSASPGNRSSSSPPTLSPWSACARCTSCLPARYASCATSTSGSRSSCASSAPRCCWRASCPCPCTCRCWSSCRSSASRWSCRCGRRRRSRQRMRAQRGWRGATRPEDQPRTKSTAATTTPRTTTALRSTIGDNRRATKTPVCPPAYAVTASRPACTQCTRPENTKMATPTTFTINDSTPLSAFNRCSPSASRMPSTPSSSTPRPPPAGHGITTGVHVGVFLSAVYGSYFGAGLGVLLLGVLGILLADGLQRLNALKGVLSLIVNVVGVAVFVFSGRVHWVHAGLLAVTASAGGHTGVFVARRLSPMVLRYAVVVLGVVVAAVLFVRG